jgi:hypothetical protein
MRQFSTFSSSIKLLLAIAPSFFLSINLFAQQTSISDFVIFGGSKNSGHEANSAPDCGVQIGSASTIRGGSIGSYGLVKSTGNLTANTNIFSGGTIQLANGNVVTGRIAAANYPYIAGTILSIGSSTSIGGNIDVNGNIIIGGGTLSGNVTHPTGTTYTGPSIGSRNIIGAPALPVLPSMPAVTTFPAAGTVNITTTQTIKPGSFGNITLGGNKTLTLSGTGVYVFKSIKNSGTTNNFVFDFGNDPVGTIKIYVYGDVDLNKVMASINNGGSESRIYSETHGTGSTCSDGPIAWNIANGSSGQPFKWVGSVWAPFAAINIGSGTGSSSIKGALWSGTQVNIQSNNTITFAPFNFCTPPNVNAGADKALDFVNQTTLNGLSTTSGVSFSWQALNGGVITSPVNAASITVSAAGTYVLTASSGSGCSSTDTVIVTGKSNSLIGSELQSVYDNLNPNAPPSPFFTVQHDSIYIDIITVEGQYAAALAKFTNAPFGLTNLLSNGTSNFIITGLFPISKLPLLNVETSLIVYIRPYYAAFGNSGIVTTAGDTAMRSNLVRNGYQLQGAGVKVGVISDSYNTILAGTSNPKTNTAAQDIANDDLPGIRNPNGNTTPVTVLKDYPFKRTDEGRGMLQIVHDVAPKAELFFRTGFISAGDFAMGIGELKQAGCNIIVDDVTFITEPFLKDGVVAAAVDAVTASGTTYFSAAGNFANKSYENSFNRITPAGKAHDFGGGDTLQSVTLKPGNYTIVLQWLDDIYSLGQTSGGGTKNDLDIYLTPDGKSLFGFNRNNTNGDPIEILPFTIAGTSTVNTNILITNNTPGSNPVRFKYIVFQGDITINEYNTGSSTLVGQANALGAIAVGAARYDKVPPYPGPLAVESFSSIGGTFVNGQQRKKPDLVAPDGGNTTVNLGPDYPANALDGYPNFFGTSAAAPHAAAVAALIMEGKKKYSNQPLTSPGEIRSILQSSATDMETPGFDFTSGYGFVNADSAMRTFAKPDPTLIRLVVPAGVIPGTAAFTVTVTGVNLSPTSIIKFRDSSLATTVLNSGAATAVVPAFIGNPLISVYTPPVSTSGLDGGSSDSLKFFTIAKKTIIITADNKTKKFAQDLPAFTTTILVDSVSLQNTQLTLADLGLSGINLISAAIASSSVGTYAIVPSRVFDLKNPVDIGLLELYNYKLNPGSITIAKLPVTVTAKSFTIVYGQKIPDIQFTYQFSGINISDSVGLLKTIQSTHQGQLAKDALGNDVIGLVNGQAVTIVNGQAVPIVNGQAVTIVNGQAVTIVNGQAIPIVNSQAVTIVNGEQTTGTVNGQAVTIVNGTVTDTNRINLTAAQVSKLSFLATAPTLQNAHDTVNKTLVNGIYVTGTTKVVDITQESILDFNNNSAQTYMLSSVSQSTPKGLVDMESVVNGQAVTIVNGNTTSGILNGQAVTIVNGQAVTIVNGQAVTIVNGQAVTIVNGQAVTIVNGKAVPIVNNQNKDAVIVDSSEIGLGVSALKSLNMITGLEAGNQFVIPGTLLDDNLDITHIAGIITILPAPVTITVTSGQTKIFGSADPAFAFGNNIGLNTTDFTGAVGRGNGNDVGSYAYTLGTLSAGTNYSLGISAVTPLSTFSITAKTDTISPTADQSKIYGDADPAEFTYSGSAPLTTFTGALGRVNGSDVGNYAYTLGNLSGGINYNLVLSATEPVSTFAITAKTVTISPTTGQSKIYGDADPVAFTYYSSDSLATFTGALCRVSGSDVGNYAYTLGNLSAGINYNLVLSATVPVSSFAITIKTVTISPTTGQSKIYGDADPAAFTYSGSDPLATVTGALGRVSGTDAGNYTYTLGNLSAGTNYNLVLATTAPVSVFTVTKAPLSVKADDKVIFKGDVKPSFTSTIKGLVNGDNPIVIYMLNPNYTGAAGVYAIQPSLDLINYTVSITNGTLYVNPKGWGAEDVDIRLNCVEDRGATYLPANRRYVAHFYAENDNTTTVYVPIGTDNKLTSAGSFDGSLQPVVFVNGITHYNVPFDGGTLKWALGTYNGNYKIVESVTASSSSNKCTSYAGGRTDNTNTMAVQNASKIAQPEKNPAGNVNVFPNPVRNLATIYLSNDIINVKGLLLTDAYGRQHPVKLVRQVSKHSIEIDLSGLASGMYFIKVKGENGYKNINIVKE